MSLFIPDISRITSIFGGTTVSKRETESASTAGAAGVASATGVESRIAGIVRGALENMNRITSTLANYSPSAAVVSQRISNAIANVIRSINTGNINEAYSMLESVSRNINVLKSMAESSNLPPEVRRELLREIEETQRQLSMLASMIAYSNRYYAPSYAPPPPPPAQPTPQPRSGASKLMLGLGLGAAVAAAAAAAAVIASRRSPSYS